MSEIKLDMAQTFGIPVVKVKNAYRVSDNELNYIKNLPFRQRRNAKISDDLFILNKDSILNNLKKVINECSAKFIREIICVDNDFQMTNSWIARSDSVHSKHNHVNTIFSVVYYVQADDATLRFHREKNFVTESLYCDLSYKSFNHFNSTNMNFEVSTGDIMIFPGYILHEGINHSQNEKIILGANYFIRGDVGKYNNVTSLII